MGMTGFFDTNILIDFLNGVPEARQTLDSCSHRIISRISWIEVMAGLTGTDEEDLGRRFLSQFEISEITSATAESAVLLRRHHIPKLRLPDALILASARLSSCRLTTRNHKDFPPDSPDIHIPYQL